jgi:hypothetical protein
MARGSSSKYEPASYPMTKLITWGMYACVVMALMCLGEMYSMRFLHPKLAQPYHWLLTIVLFLGNVTVAVLGFRIRNDRIEINDEGVHRVMSNGKRVTLEWKDISKLIENKGARKFILSNEKNTKRIVVDATFKNAGEIKERILAQGR